MWVSNVIKTAKQVVPSQEEHPTTIPEQDATERILEHGSEAEAPPVPRVPMQTTLEA